MDIQRSILITAIAAISLTLMVKWNQFKEHHPALDNSAMASVMGSDTPTLQENKDHTASEVPAAPEKVQTANTSLVDQQKIINITTDNLQVSIDTVGGDIVMLALRDYPAKIENPTDPFPLLTRSNDHIYVAQSGLIGENGIDDKSSQRPVYHVNKTQYVMQDGENELQVDLTLADNNDVTITKRYTFTRHDHVIRLDYLIENHSNHTWNGHLYGQIKRDSKEPASSASGLGMKPFLGAATSTTEKNYLKLTFKEMAKTPLKSTIQGGWIAMVQHYFISAWVPGSKDNNQFYTVYKPENDTYLLGFTGPNSEIAPGTTGTLSARFYAGPKDVYKLEKIAPYLDLTVDYGWLWWIAKPLFWLLHLIHSWIGNWGWAVIGLTVVVKSIFLYPSTLSYRSMAVMKKIAPKMQDIKEKYADNPNKYREEIFSLYKKEKVNPMLGCLPMLIQMPVFMALFWSLQENVELRQAPFMGWIVDLSAMDPYFVLPVLMGVSMWAQQKLNPPAADPMQQKIFQMMPVIFTAMFLFFPVGLVLYMLVNNLISMVHQYWVQKSLA